MKGISIIARNKLRKGFCIFTIEMRNIVYNVMESISVRTNEIGRDLLKVTCSERVTDSVQMPFE